MHIAIVAMIECFPIALVLQVYCMWYIMMVCYEKGYQFVLWVTRWGGIYVRFECMQILNFAQAA